MRINGTNAVDAAHETLAVANRMVEMRNDNSRFARCADHGSCRRPAFNGLPALLAVALAIVPALAAAQVPAPPQTQPIALTGATIHTVTNGVIENGTIVFDGGVIVAVGANVAVPAGARRVDATGKHIYPGLIDAYSAMGLEEIGAVDVTSDTNELGDFNPNVRAEVAVNPESRHIGTARSNGVLVTITTPAGGRVSGLSAAMMLDGWTWESMTLKSGAALNVNWPDPGDDDEYADNLRELRELFAGARAYRDARGSGGHHDTDSRWEAMVPVVNGDVPVVVAAGGIREMQDAIAWAEDEGVRLVIRGGEDALYIADHLAAKQIPVLLTNTMDGPTRGWEGYTGNYALAARLHEKGVRFAITGGSSAPYTHRLPYEAGVAVAFGLPVDEALRAVTIQPATFLGIADRVGSLETGKDATLLITTGNPLDYLATVEQAYVQGREIDMMDIHKQLFEKYSEKVRQTRASGN
ncbi:MAG TPA: amidohydrolase family protein [Longimicrobiales bacterium]|nr:amidohydrolase family protein [Longimicrobiales bacterium]